MYFFDFVHLLCFCHSSKHRIWQMAKWQILLCVDENSFERYFGTHHCLTRALLVVVRTVRKQNNNICLVLLHRHEILIDALTDCHFAKYVFRHLSKTTETLRFCLLSILSGSVSDSSTVLRVNILRQRRDGLSHRLVGSFLQFGNNIRQQFYRIDQLRYRGKRGVDFRDK